MNGHVDEARALLNTIPKGTELYPELLATSIVTALGRRHAAGTSSINRQQITPPLGENQP